MLSIWSKDIVLTPREKGQSLSRKLALSLDLLIEKGIIAADQPLPPVRILATSLSVNRGIVLSAYRMLAEKGRVTSHVGRGTFPRGSLSRLGKQLATAFLPHPMPLH
jgi:DNA-binding GntR family transcriptional regulator